MTALVILAVLASWLPVLSWPAFRRRRILREARDAGVPVPWTWLLGMRFRRVDPGQVFGPLARAARAGIPLSGTQVEGHLLAGGDPGRVVDALVLARRRGVDTDFPTLSVVDLVGRDPVALVRDHGIPGRGADPCAMLAMLDGAARNSP